MTNDAIVSPSIPQEQTEIWMDIPSYIGIYQASNLGRFRSVTCRMRTRMGDILHGSRLPVGYRYIRLTDANGIKTRYLSHRVILSTFSPIDGWESLDVNHKNGDKGDNRLENLEWMTHKDNIIHARQVLDSWKASRERRPKKIKVLKGTARGERIVSSKLSAEDVRQIREFGKRGKMTQSEIAALFGVSSTTVCLIINRKQWAHIE
jgi:hypothetical protein